MDHVSVVRQRGHDNTNSLRIRLSRYVVQAQ
jgi:hypothetical protein